MIIFFYLFKGNDQIYQQKRNLQEENTVTDLSNDTNTNSTINENNSNSSTNNSETNETKKNSTENNYVLNSTSLKLKQKTKIIKENCHKYIIDKDYKSIQLEFDDLKNVSHILISEFEVEFNNSCNPDSFKQCSNKSNYCICIFFYNFNVWFIR